jgi:hypothetical protein
MLDAAVEAAVATAVRWERRRFERNSHRRCPRRGTGDDKSK